MRQAAKERGVIAFVMLLIGGLGSAYMLTRLDRESRRLFELDKYWYPGKKRGTDESDVKK
jgi:hypothetical protein